VVGRQLADTTVIIHADFTTGHLHDHSIHETTHGRSCHPQRSVGSRDGRRTPVTIDPNDVARLRGQNGAVPDDPAAAPVLRVGCAMWAHPPWVGHYLSPGNKGRELADYATWCNAVEGNTTFYGIPSERTVARWAEQAPPDFRFAFKVPRTVTHEQRLRDGAHRDVARFLKAIEPLGDRIGPVQIQLPPSFGPESVAILADFVVGLPTSHRWVAELRHPGFFDGGVAHRRTDEALVAADVGRVVLDTRPLYAASPRSDASFDERRTKPMLPIVTDVMGVEPIVRVIGSDDADATIDGASAWSDQVVDWLGEGHRPFVFLHQPENLYSPALARRFHAVVADRVTDLAPLPEPTTVADAGEVSGQTPLF